MNIILIEESKRQAKPVSSTSGGRGKTVRRTEL